MSWNLRAVWPLQAFSMANRCALLRGNRGAFPWGVQPPHASVFSETCAGVRTVAKPVEWTNEVEKVPIDNVQVVCWSPCRLIPQSVRAIVSFDPVPDIHCLHIQKDLCSKVSHTAANRATAT